jgi:hypothetical protein
VEAILTACRVSQKRQPLSREVAIRAIATVGSAARRWISSARVPVAAVSGSCLFAAAQKLIVSLRIPS